MILSVVEYRFKGRISFPKVHLEKQVDSILYRYLSSYLEEAELLRISDYNEEFSRLDEKVGVENTSGPEIFVAIIADIDREYVEDAAHFKKEIAGYISFYLHPESFGCEFYWEIKNKQFFIVDLAFHPSNLQEMILNI